MFFSGGSNNVGLMLQIRRLDRDLATANEWTEHWADRAREAEHQLRRRDAGILSRDARIYAHQRVVYRLLVQINGLIKNQKISDEEYDDYINVINRSMNEAYIANIEDQGHTQRDDDGFIFVDGPYRVIGEVPEEDLIIGEELKNRLRQDQGREEEKSAASESVGVTP